MIARYKLDDNATNTTVLDSEGSHNGVASSNTDTLSTTGKLDEAFDLTSGDYVTINDHADFNFGTLPSSISLWFKKPSIAGEDVIIAKRAWINATEDGYALALLNSTTLRVHYYTDRDYTISNVVDNVWHHLAILFDYDNNETTVYLDNSFIATKSHTQNSQSNSYDLYLGINELKNLAFNGYLDDIRFYRDKLLTPSEIDDLFNLAGEPIGEDKTIEISEETTFQETRDFGEETISIDESSSIKQSISFEEDETINIGESDLELQESLSKEETISINEDTVISQSLEKIEEEESITIDEDSEIAMVGDIDVIYNTDLRTLLVKAYKFATNLITSLFSSNKYSTKLNTKYDTENIYDTDLRVRFDDYDSIDLGSLNDFVVKLDSVELTDVDYSTLRIVYELNSTPSSATFTLARRHDKLDYKLDGTLSEITDENKVEIYDGTTKIFTGYITKIAGVSSTDTVNVTAEDARYKFSRTSMELEYGGKYEQDEDDEEVYNKSEKNVGTAISEVISQISSYISGYDNVPFATSFIPEYSKVYDNCASLLDTLITQTANANWYLDENERLKYQKIANGTIKTLPLSSLTKHRHAYDVILSDINLNRQSSAYAKSLNIKLGTHIIQRWARRYFTGWSDQFVSFYNSLKEKIAFGFQQWGVVGSKWYCGILQTIYSYSSASGWILLATIVVQYQYKDEDDDLDDITVGSGSPRRTVHLTNYGKKEVNTRWEERIHPTEEVPYLTYVIDESYDYTAFAQDMAEFELNQNNQLQTEARVTLLLDAYKYYNLKVSDRINLSNTIETDIYNNNNGFPLNIRRVTIDCSTRVVELTLSNEGKSWYVRTANYLTNYVAPSIQYVMKKQSVIEFSQGL